MTQAPTVALPKRLPLVIAPSNRDESVRKDARLVNCYVERVDENDYQIYKRPGLDEHSRPPAGNAAGCGTYNWLGDIYSVFGPTLYKNGVSVGTVDATNGVYRFSSCLGSTPKLQLGNGVKAYNYDSGAGLVQITDPQFPTSFVKGWAYLDATTYVMKATAHIQGSDLNDPVNWDVLNDILAQIEPDQGVALAKQLVYVTGLKQWTTEIFYDAANSTGSPLSPVQGAKLNWGCVTADSVQDIDGVLLWAATNRSSAVSIILVENLKATPVSTKPIERLLENADFSVTYSWTLKINGHKFYVLTLPNENLTLAYDLAEKMWSQWTDSDGNYLPIVSSTYNTNMEHILQHATNGRLYLASDSFYTDDGEFIQVDIYTPNFDGGTRRRKQMTMFEVIGDQVPGSIIQVRKNDSDYNAKGWSNFRNVDMSKKRAFLTDCGTFVKRAHNLRHRCNTQMRISAVDLQLDLGTL